eukprot:1141358-Pelagomonas_calceolata.AAC.14
MLYFNVGMFLCPRRYDQQDQQNQQGVSLKDQQVGSARSFKWSMLLRRALKLVLWLEYAGNENTLRLKTQMP